MPIREIRLEGLKRTEAARVREQIKSREGLGLKGKTLRDDMERIYRLGGFRSINPTAKMMDDHSIVVTLNIVEAPIIKTVEVVGNSKIATADIVPVVKFLEGKPSDEINLGS